MKYVHADPKDNILKFATRVLKHPVKMGLKYYFVTAIMLLRAKEQLDQLFSWIILSTIYGIIHSDICSKVWEVPYAVGQEVGFFSSESSASNAEFCSPLPTL